MSQAVHDLLWVINSPSFVGGDNVADPGALAHEDVDAASLHAFLAERGLVHRVGRYFEQLVHYWLEHVQQFEVLGAGLQIRDGKRTIGELDFVYLDHGGAVVHCEVAVKFFLYYAHGGNSDFPGPNASDNFELKTAKLFNKQLELSRLHYPSVQRREAFVKGMAFYRSDRPEDLPARMNPDHARGAWLRAADLDRLVQDEPVGAAIVQKPHWLAPEADAQVESLAIVAAKLRDHFADGGGHPIMLSLRDPSTVAEIERVFVVSEHWPVTDRD